MTIEKQHNGSYLISAIIGIQYVKKVYYGYTKLEAKQRFNAEFIKPKQ